MNAELAALRAEYRAMWMSLCLSASDLDHALPGDEADRDRQAVLEDRAALEALEFALRVEAPLRPDAVPGWPGGWMPGHQVRALRHGRAPDVHATIGDAVTAGLDERGLVWTPMCRATDGGRWLLLDGTYWAAPHADPLTTTEHDGR